MVGGAHLTGCVGRVVNVPVFVSIPEVAEHHRLCSNVIGPFP